MKISGEVNQVSLARVRKAIDGMPSRVFAPMKREFAAIGNQWERNVGARFTGSTGPTSLHTRTGQLAGSLQSEVTGTTLNDLTLRCVSRGPNYTRIQEFGGEVKPKNGKYLTIPLPGNRTPAGVARVTARQLKEPFFIRTEAGGRGHLLLMEGKPSATVRKASGITSRGNAVPMFLLVTKVELPGPKAPNKKGPSRLGFFEEFQKLNARQRIIDHVARAIGRAG